MKKLFPLFAIFLTLNVYAADDSEVFQALVQRDWDFRLNEFPELARYTGSKEMPARLPMSAKKTNSDAMNIANRCKENLRRFPAPGLSGRNVSTTGCSAGKYISSWRNMKPVLT